MAINEIQVQFQGRVGADPAIRPAGDKRVLSLRLVTSARVKKGQEWVDSEGEWFDGSLWDRFPNDRRIDNVAESLAKGALVEVTGSYFVEAYESRDGSAGVARRLTIKSIAPALDRSVAQLVQNERGAPAGGGQAPAGWGAPAPAAGGWGAPAQAQPNWGAPAAAPAQAAPPAAAPAPAAPQQQGFSDGFGETF